MASPDIWNGADIDWSAVGDLSDLTPTLHSAGRILTNVNSGHVTIGVQGSVAPNSSSATGNGDTAVMLNAAPPPPVVTENLADDTGISNTDRITSKPEVQGTGAANATVTITENGNVIGTTVAAFNGQWTFTPTELTDGTHTLVASETNAGGTGSASLTFVLDTTAPTQVHDTGAALAPGATVTIISSMLDYSDNISNDANERYSIVQTPTNGQILLNGAPTTGFTQGDIDNGLVSYKETAAGVVSDNVVFTVADQAGNTTAATDFGITVGTPSAMFGSPRFVLSTFGASPSAGGWGSQATYPVAVGDVTGDGVADIVGFGAAGVYVSLNTGGGNFAQPILGLNELGADAGWGNQNAYPLELGDVWGNGRDDIVGFSAAGVYVAWSNGDGTFGNANLVLDAFGADAGWGNQNAYPLELGDVTGNGRVDIVGLGAAGVYVSLSNGNGTFGNGTFAQPFLALDAFGADAGWGNQSQYPIEMGDVTGNGRDDIVGFGAAGVYVSLANPDGTFAQPILALDAFGADRGWGNQQLYPIELADVLGNGREDIVGFGAAGVYVALANGDGTFAQPVLATNNFGAAGGWSNQNEYPRLLGDVNGDKQADIVGFGSAGVYTALSQPQAGAGVALH